MIVDLGRFLAEARPRWNELEGMLERIERRSSFRMDLEAVKRFHLLYQRASADLAGIATFAAEPRIHQYLESLVARAYAQTHHTRPRVHRFAPLRWFFHSFPQTFRRHIRAFLLSAAVTCLGSAFGGSAIWFDADAKEVILPPGLAHLQQDPSERVRRAEAEPRDPYRGSRKSASAMYMTHNTKVSIMVLAMGLTWGIGTIVMLFYNGAILGAVAADYVRAGEATFLGGWLLPHGSVEIPAILLAGQAGLVLAAAMIGWGNRAGFRMRMRKVVPDLVTLILGVALMLVWAGVVETYLSQHHEPALPYWMKIAFGAVELVLLAMWLGLSGTGKSRRETAGT